MASRPLHRRDEDGSCLEDLGYNVVEPLTHSDTHGGEDEGKDVDGSKEIERESPKTDEEVPQLLFGRWVVFACAVLNFGLGLSLPLAMSTMFVEWQETFKISRAHTVVVHSTAVGLLFGAAILPGYFMERYGARLTVLLGCGLSSAGCFISIFATNINYLIFSVGILGGFGFCFIQLPSLPCVCEVFPKHGSVVVSLCTFGSALFNMSMPFVYTHLINKFSWRGTYLFITAFSMQTSVLGLLMTSQLEAPLHKDTSFKGEDSDTCLKEDTLEVGDVNGEVLINEQGISEDKTISLREHNSTISRKDDDLQNKKSNLNRSSIFRKPSPLVSRILNSKWKFIIDGMYLLIMFHIAACLAVQFCFAIMIMDFARTKGFPEDNTGTFFLLVIFLNSLVGRLVIGALNLLPFVHSITAMGIFGAISSFGMIMLGSASSYTSIIVFLGFQGFGIGGVVSIYPKCILDAELVSFKNYPLALGLSCTWEGIFDFLVPILIGHAVDTHESYTLILQLLGSISLLSSIAITVIRMYLDYHQCRRLKTPAGNSS